MANKRKPFKIFSHWYYHGLLEEINDQDLRKPNSYEIASLICDAFRNPKRKQSSYVKSALNSGYVWEFTGNLYLPKSNEEFNNGVIIESFPNYNNKGICMDKESLIKRLRNVDSEVKFVPFGFKTGEQTWRELEKNDYVVARYGKEGAEKISEVASRYNKNPVLEVFNKKDIDEEFNGMSALRSYYEEFNPTNLYIFGILNGGNHKGHAFGLVP